MGELYNLYKERENDIIYFTKEDKLGLLKIDYNDKKYELFISRKRANKYSIIHCKDNTIEWEQFPVLPRVAGRLHGTKEPLLRIGPTKECVRIFVVRGKPNSIIGLDEGVFCSVHKYDENKIIVMSEARFKEL